MTEYVFVVIRKEDWANQNGDLMLSSCESRAVFEQIDSAIKYVLDEAAKLEAYAYKIGIKSKDIEIARMLDENYGTCRIFNMSFPEDRGHNEDRSVTWRIETTKIVKG